MQRQNTANMIRQDMIRQDNRPTAFGFKGKAFPFLAFLLGIVSYLGTYIVARNRNPPDVWPFPDTDILHTAIHYPEYLIYRIGMLVYPILYCLSMQSMKNFLQMKSFEIKGQTCEKLNNFGVMIIAATLLQCFSTAAISDGGDLNYPLYYWGNRLYWALSLIMIYLASTVYRDLYHRNQFISSWNYEFKNYGGFAAIAMIIVYSLQYLKVIDFGNYPEWIISLFIVFYVGTLYFDLKDMDLLLRRK